MSIKKFVTNFVRCGITGWCFEILYTGLNSLRRRDRKLTSTTSLWMFPIYGSAAFIEPVSRLLERRPMWVRGLAYMSMIFTGEYWSGNLLRKYSLCPWDYSKSYHNIRRNIRLDYAPLWFAAGLFFEQLLKPAKAEVQKAHRKKVPKSHLGRSLSTPLQKDT